jgi:hypothetical protein
MSKGRTRGFVRLQEGEPDADPFSPEAQSPYEITALMEFKTVWHPMGA